MANEILLYLLKLLPLIIVLGGGGVKLRDMIKENRLRIISFEKKQEDCQKAQEEKNSEIQKLIKALEEKREKDLIETQSLKGIGTVIDNKIKMELAGVMKEISAQRHEDLMLFKDALHALENNFTKTLSDVRETLAKFNSTVESLGKEVERVKEIGRK
jgi:hypothetical protein